MEEPNPIETLRNGVNFALSFLDLHDVCLDEFGNAIAGAAIVPISGAAHG